MVFRRLLKDSAVYGVADFISNIVAFFTFPLIAAALAPAGFGLLELIVTTVTLLGLIVNCGINNGVQRFYWDVDAESRSRQVIVSSGLAAIVVFGILGVLVGMLAVPIVTEFAEEYDHDLTSLALVAALFFMAFTQWNRYALDVLRLQFSPWKYAGVAAVSRIGSALAGVWVVVFLGMGIEGLLSVQAIVLFAVLPVAFFLIRRDLKLTVDRRWVVELTRFGYPFIFSGIAYWLFGSIDRWMLAGMRSVEEVGIYSVAFKFAMVVMFVSMAFGQAWSPLAMKLRKDHPDTYPRVYGDVLLVLLYVMFIVGGGIALFAGEIIGLIMSDAYAASALPLAILSFGIILQSTQQVTAVGISIEKRTVLFAHLAWLTAVVNGCLNWLLIPEYGANGAAWATLLSYALLTGSYLYYTQRLHPLTIVWKNLLMLLLLGFVVFIVSIALVRTDWDVGSLSAKTLTAISCLYVGWCLIPRGGRLIGS